MGAEDTLIYEARHRQRQMVIAAAAGALLMVAAIVSLLGPHAAVSELTLSLVTQHRRATLTVIAAVLNALAEISIGITLLYLWRCASARTERSMPVLPFLVIAGVLLALVGNLAYAFLFNARAADFVHTGAQTYDQADRLTAGALLLVPQILSQVGALLIAISFVLVCLGAMRVGLLPRFLAYVGMFAGVLILFPIIAVPIVQLYFLVAVAILFSGNWPSGLPPAWQTGAAVAWPSAAETRARRQAENEAVRGNRAEQRRARRTRTRDRVAPDPAPAAEASAPTTTEAPDATPAPARRKRKRKR